VENTDLSREDIITSPIGDDVVSVVREDTIVADVLRDPSHDHQESRSHRTLIIRFF